ncbi:MAG: hypothetical protein IJP29_07595 [Lachnospiraceae bacterium]|nr:hypothetical protein [Lachnospiraceae bacterium]
MVKRTNNYMLYTYGMLILGVMLGSLVFLSAIMCGNQYLLNFGLEDFDVAVLFNAPESKIIIHIMKKRIIQLFIFVLLTILTSYPVATTVFCGSFGAYYGIVICNLILKYGISGLGYGLACFFPHFMLYFLIIYLIGLWRANAASSAQKYYGNVTKIEMVVKIVVIFSLFLIAVIWEMKFQKNFLNYFFQYLV